MIVYLKNEGKEEKKQKIISLPKKHGSYLISFLSGFFKLFIFLFFSF